MESRIIFLIGAGASAKTIPIVSDFNSGLGDFITFLERNRINTGDKILKNDIVWLRNSIGNSRTFDTLAKQFTITKPSDLHKLKCLLSVYLTYCQVENEPDPRYDTFFASITSISGKLNEKISVISWNYDNQFEMSFSNFSRNRSVLENRRLLQVQDFSNDRITPFRDFKIFKMNGSVGFVDANGVYVEILNDFLNIKISHALADLQNAYFDLYDDLINKVYHPTIRFAWESSADSIFLHTIGKEISQSFISLVIIGYSLPFFNKDFDAIILKAIENVDKIFLQDKNPEPIIQRLLAFRPDLERKFNLLPNTDQFFIPYSL